MLKDKISQMREVLPNLINLRGLILSQKVRSDSVKSKSSLSSHHKFSNNLGIKILPMRRIAETEPLTLLILLIKTNRYLEP
jgi:hypothetical protein